MGTAIALHSGPSVVYATPVLAFLASIEQEDDRARKRTTLAVRLRGRADAPRTGGATPVNTAAVARPAPGFSGARCSTCDRVSHGGDKMEIGDAAMLTDAGFKRMPRAAGMRACVF